MLAKYKIIKSKNILNIDKLGARVRCPRGEHVVVTALERGSHKGDTSRGKPEKGSHEGDASGRMLYVQNSKLKRKERKESKGAFARYLYIVAYRLDSRSTSEYTGECTLRE
jgi:hypothetical protein